MFPLHLRDTVFRQKPHCQALTPMPQVKNKTFFGMVLIFNQILQDWSILREASLAVMLESKGQASRLFQAV